MISTLRGHSSNTRQRYPCGSRVHTDRDIHSHLRSLTHSLTNMLLFNAGDGYSEAIVRGYKLGLISSNQYSNLTQCETVEGKTKEIKERLDN